MPPSAAVPPALVKAATAARPNGKASVHSREGWLICCPWNMKALFQDRSWALKRTSLFTKYWYSYIPTEKGEKYRQRQITSNLLTIKNKSEKMYGPFPNHFPFEPFSQLPFTIYSLIMYPVIVGNCEKYLGVKTPPPPVAGWCCSWTLCFIITFFWNYGKYVSELKIVSMLKINK